MKQYFNYYIIFVFLLLNSSATFARDIDTIAPLKVGDQMINLQINNLKNYPRQSVSISDFKEKLLILDFWATWCSSCYGYFPKIDQLQKKFADQVQFILVNSKRTRDTEEKINKLFAKLYDNAKYKVKLPYVNEEPILANLFPFYTLPQYIWIGGDGIIKAITSASEINSENILKVLAGGALHTKADVPNFDFSKPLSADLFNRPEVKKKYRSQLTGYIEGIGTRYNSVASSMVSRVFRLNMPLKMLFTMDRVIDELIDTSGSPGMERTLPNSQVIFNTTNPKFKSDFLNSSDDLYENRYTYELILPGELSFNDIIKPMIKEEFSIYFNFKVSQVVQKAPVYVLKTTAKLKRLKSTFDVAKYYSNSKYYKTTAAISLERNAVEKYARNTTVSTFLYLLNEFSTIPIFTNEVFTEEAQRYDFDLPTDIYDYSPKQLKAYLQGLGFEVVEEERTLPFAVFSDRYK